MEALTKDLWVFVETKEDGSARNVGLELLNPGKELAAKQGGSVVAIIIGQNTGAAEKEAATYGAEKIIVINGDEYAHYNTDAYANALEYLIKKYGPTTVSYTHLPALAGALYKGI